MQDERIYIELHWRLPANVWSWDALGPDRVEALVDSVKQHYIDGDETAEVFEERVDMLLRHGHQIDWWPFTAWLKVWLDLDEAAMRYPAIMATAV